MAGFELESAASLSDNTRASFQGRCGPAMVHIGLFIFAHLILENNPTFDLAAGRVHAFYFNCCRDDNS
jgi:hypothetical protein